MFQRQSKDFFFKETWCERFKNYRITKRDKKNTWFSATNLRNKAETFYKKISINEKKNENFNL